MIDGVKIYCELQDFEKWKTATNITFDFAVLDTGAIKEKIRNNAGITIRTITHRAKFETF